VNFIGLRAAVPPIPLSLSFTNGLLHLLYHCTVTREAACDLACHTGKAKFRKFQIFAENELRGFSPNFHIHVSVSDLYLYITIDRSAYSAAGKYVDRSWEYINRSQTHECGN
jgi:hypothetical protein